MARTAMNRGGARGGGVKKAFTKKRAASEGDDSAPRTSKKSKGDDVDDLVPVVPELKMENGEAYINLNTSGKRRVTVQDYNKSILVNIREYYVTDAGEYKPGKKGISLTIEQYNVLLAAAPLLESELAKKNIQVVRPDYDVDPSAKAEAPKEEDQYEDDDEEAAEDAVAKVDDDDEEDEE